MNLLLVDGDGATQSALVRSLSRKGFNDCACGDGLQAHKSGLNTLF